MRIFAISLLLFSSSLFAEQGIDPKFFCETKTATIALASFKHCKAGDLIKVDSYELQSLCELSSPIVPVQNEYLCIYRGLKREIRKRPLSEAEKALDKEHLEGIVEKYAN